jgi:adenosylcobinamide-phosphate synthase
MSALIAFLSLAVEAKLGYPDRLFAWIGHPVTWIGRLISFIDSRLNRATDSDRTRRLCGMAGLAVIVAVPTLIASLVERALLAHALGFFVVVLLGTTLLAQKSLAAHVEAVAKALDTGGLAAGREAVSKIVGRDPESLDSAAVSRAAIESLAENFSDGVVAPAFWMSVGGLAGGAAYKAANTADSMIGHQTPRHEAFGWASARFDDLVNLPASRLTALLIVAAAAILPDMDARAAWHAVWRDAKKHRSPNAGWPEAAMAGALGIALAGPRSYGGVMGDYAFMGEGGRREVTAADIGRALRLFWMADVLLMAVLGVVGLALVG